MNEFKKNFKVKDPLSWGMIWHLKWMTDKEKRKDGLKKFRFKKINKAKKYHRYECNFWNNKMILTITKKYVFIDCFNIDEENETMNYARTLDIGTKFAYEEIKWFVDTMKKIHKVRKDKEKEVSITKNEYELKKSYSNGAFEFEKLNDGIISNIVFWDNEDGGVIEISQGLEDVFDLDIEVKIDGFDGKDIYFPVINRHLSLPIELMKEILKDMESIE